MRHVLLSACAVALTAATKVPPKLTQAEYATAFSEHFVGNVHVLAISESVAKCMIENQMENHQFDYLVCAAKLYCTEQTTEDVAQDAHDFLTSMSTSAPYTLVEHSIKQEVQWFNVLSTCHRSIFSIFSALQKFDSTSSLQGTTTISKILVKLAAEAKADSQSNSDGTELEISKGSANLIKYYTRPALILDLMFQNDMHASILLENANTLYVEYCHYILKSLEYTNIVNAYFKPEIANQNITLSKDVYPFTSEVTDAAKTISDHNISPVDKLAVAFANEIMNKKELDYSASANSFGSDAQMSFGDRVLLYMALNIDKSKDLLPKLFKYYLEMPIRHDVKVIDKVVNLNQLLFEYVKSNYSTSILTSLSDVFSVLDRSQSQVKWFIHCAIELLHVRSQAAADSLDSVRYPDNVIICMSTMYAEGKIPLDKIKAGHIPCRCLHDEKDMFEIGAMSRYILYGQPQCLEEASKMLPVKPPYWNDYEFTVLTDTFKLYVSTLLKNENAYQEAHVMMKAMHKLYCVSFVGRVTIHDKAKVQASLEKTLTGGQLSKAMLLFSKPKENLSPDEKRALLTEHAKTLSEHQRPAVLTHRDHTYFPFESTGTIDASFYARQSDAVRLGELMKRIEDRQKRVMHYADFGSGWYIFFGVVLVIAVSACCLCRRKPKKTEVPITHTNSEVTADARKEVEEEETKRPDIAV